MIIVGKAVIEIVVVDDPAYRLGPVETEDVVGPVGEMKEILEVAEVGNCWGIQVFVHQLDRTVLVDSAKERYWNAFDHH